MRSQVIDDSQWTLDITKKRLDALYEWSSKLDHKYFSARTLEEYMASLDYDLSDLSYHVRHYGIQRKG